MIRRGALIAWLSLVALAAPARPAWASQDDEAALIARGRYLVVIGGCNDCHTAGYPERAGNVPELDWLTGSPLGWHGPWGTSYASNLRLLVNRMSEAQWLKQVRTVEARPPMPWFTLRRMTESDLRAIYAFIRHLGPAGSEAPAPLLPAVAPPPPVVEFPGPPPGER